MSSTVRRTGPVEKGCVTLFFGMFLLMGLATAVLIGHSTWKNIRTRSWEATPCTITSSKLQPKSGDYVFNVRYYYTFNGKEFVGTRFRGSDNDFSKDDDAQRALRQYPSDSQATCYVNASAPEESVLEKGSLSELLWLLFPIPFLAVGGVFIWAVWSRERPYARAISARPTVSGTPSGTTTPLRGVIGEIGGSVVLKPASSPLGNFIGTLIIALLCNGIVLGVLFKVHLSTFSSKVVWGFFALFGLASFAAAIQQFLALLNPRPTLETNSRAVRLGQGLQIRFSFTGRIQRIQKLTIHLRGREEATYRRGTDTSTDKSVFTEEVLLETSNPAQMQSGNVAAQIPANAMHSFDAPNNKIIWSVHLHGAIPRWSDIDVEFPITVLPLEIVQTERATV